MGNELTPGRRPYSMPLNMISKKHLTELRRFSLSDGNLSSPLMAQLRGMVGGERVARAPELHTLAARDIHSPQLSGYLDRKHNTPGWDNIWGIVKDSAFYIYTSPIDEVAMDTILLPGYEIRQCDIIMEEKEFILELYHEEYQSEYYSCDSLETLQRWQEVMSDAAQKVNLDGLNLEQGNSAEFDKTEDTVKAVAMASEKQWEQELLQLKKQQLLEEVLKQKTQLEAQLRLKNKTNEPVDGEKLIKEMVQLKQRKASLSIKIGGVQRALSVYQHQRKKKRFRFPSALGSKTPKPDGDKAAPEEAFLENTMKELNEELEAVEKNITLKTLDSHLGASLPEQEVRAYQAANREKTNNGFLSSGSNSKDKSRDKKNKYSGALKFLNPHSGEADEGQFRTRAHTVASPRDRSYTPTNFSGSYESLKKRELNSSSESLKLLKNLNDVSISNATVRHSWSSEKVSGRSREASPTSSYGYIGRMAESNGIVKANGISNSPPALKASPPVHSLSPSDNAHLSSVVIDSSIHLVASSPDLYEMAAPKDMVSVTPERSADNPPEVSAEALAHIAEFEELLKEQNVPVFL